MADRSLLRRALLVLSLLVPLVMDPFGADTQGSKSTLLALCGGLLLALEGARALAGRPAPAFTLPETLLALLVAWAAASLTWATNPALGATRVVALAGVLGVARGVRAEVREAQAARRWSRALLAAGLLAVLLDGLLVLRAPVLPDAAAKHASHVFVHNNMAAGFVSLLVAFAVAALLGARCTRSRLTWGGALAALIGYLLLLGSRAGLLSALLAVGIGGVLYALRGRLQRAERPGRGLRIALGAAIVAVALVALSERARGVAKDAYYAALELSALETKDPAFRLILWRKTVELSAERPLTGVGAGNFPVEFPRHERLQVAKPHAHNDALQMQAELGLPGLLLFLGLLASTALLLRRALVGGDDRARFALAAGLLAALAVFALGGLFEVPFALGATAGTFAWVLGLAGALPGAPDVPARRARGALLLLAGLCAAGLVSWRLPASWRLARAQAAAEEGRVDDAISGYLAVAAMHTGAYPPEQQAARLLLERDRAEEALVHIRSARRLAPWSSELLVDEGKILFALGRYAEAAEADALAVRLTPESDNPFLHLQMSLYFSGQQRAALDQLEQRVREDSHVSVDFILRLAELSRVYAEDIDADDPRAEPALVAARHWYAVVAQEDPSRRPALDAGFRDLTHRLQIRPGAPDSWFKGTYRHWLGQGDWGIPGPALFIGLQVTDRMVYPGWELPPDGFPSGSWRHPSVWEDG